MNICYSCVVDHGSVFAYQALVWAWSLMDLANVPPDQIVIHTTSHCDPRIVAELAKLQTRMRTIEPHPSGHPFCNKLQQLDCEAFRNADGVVLCDTDIAFSENIESHFRADAIRAKTVDGSNPHLHLALALLQEAGLHDRVKLVDTLVDGKQTFFGNCNGGLYLIPRGRFDDLAEGWRRWASWILQRQEKLGTNTRCIDQLSFAFSVLEKGIPLEPLPAELNYPLHLFEKYEANNPATRPPSVFHYHQCIDKAGYLVKTGLPLLDTAIETINDVIRKRLRSQFSNSIFWDYRYKTSPELGSGVGSRGAVLERKRSVLYAALAGMGQPSVVDIGCGDLEVMKDAPIADYTGVDLSSEAVEICRRKKPDWKFIATNPLELPEQSCDVAMCLDVLIHQRTQADYLALVEKITRLARKAVIIAGYNQPPWHTSQITFYHEPLWQTLQQCGATSLEILGGYRDTTIILGKLPKQQDSTL